MRKSTHCVENMIERLGGMLGSWLGLATNDPPAPQHLSGTIENASAQVRVRVVDATKARQERGEGVLNHLLGFLLCVDQHERQTHHRHEPTAVEVVETHRLTDGGIEMSVVSRQRRVTHTPLKMSDDANWFHFCTDLPRGAHVLRLSCWRRSLP